MSAGARGIIRCDMPDCKSHYVMGHDQTGSTKTAAKKDGWKVSRTLDICTHHNTEAA